MPTTAHLSPRGAPLALARPLTTPMQNSKSARRAPRRADPGGPPPGRALGNAVRSCAHAAVVPACCAARAAATLLPLRFQQRPALLFFLHAGLTRSPILDVLGLHPFWQAVALGLAGLAAVALLAALPPAPPAAPQKAAPQWFSALIPAGGGGGGAVGAAGRQEAGVWSLHLFPEASGALCLDGSPGGVYVQRGSGEDAARWVVHLQGGGWCVNEDECALRAGTDLGSSSAWSRRPLFELTGMVDSGSGGIMSGDATVNPKFSSWSKAWLMYCDGASFAGDAEEASSGVDPSGERKTLYFRGRRHLGAMMEVLRGEGLDSATRDVLLTGSSAGGLAVLLHADHVRSLVAKVAPAALFKALSDSGVFPWVASQRGPLRFKQHYKNVAIMQRVRLDDSCTKAESEPWRCFLSETALPYVDATLFLFAWTYDTWQIANLAYSPCVGHFDACTDGELGAIEELGRRVHDAIKQRLLSRPDTGAFVTACRGHSGTTTDRLWQSAVIRHDVHLRDVVWRWVVARPPNLTGAAFRGGRKALALHAHLDCGGERGWTCNPDCPAIQAPKFDNGCDLYEFSPGNVQCLAPEDMPHP